MNKTANPDSKGKGVTLQTVNKTIDVLDALSETKVPLRAAELSVLTGINPTTIYGILNTLDQRGVIEKDPILNTYSMGPHALRFGISYQKNSQIVKTANAIVRQMPTDTKLATRLTILDSACEILSIIISPSTSRDSINSFLYDLYDKSSYLPLPHYASGKILLAFSDEEKLQQILKTAGIEINDQIRNIITETRNNKYAVDFDEALIGVSCVAAAIFGRDGAIVGAISHTGESQFVKRNCPEIAQHIQQVARLISLELGFRGTI